MSRDTSGRAPSPIPPWLDPALIRALAASVAAARALGMPDAAMAREIREQALASRPGWPMPWIEEAAALALWAGGADAER